VKASSNRATRQSKEAERMLYTPITKKAIRYCFDSHAGQLNGRLITATIWYLFTATKKRQEPEYHALAA